MGRSYGKTDHFPRANMDHIMKERFGSGKAISSEGRAESEMVGWCHRSFGTRLLKDGSPKVNAAP